MQISRQHELTLTIEPVFTDEIYTCESAWIKSRNGYEINSLLVFLRM